jgi:hypothetical protein
VHNPLRSEAEAFRFLIIVGLGCAAVIALALITEPVYGAILLGVLVGIGIGIAIQTSRGSERQPVAVAAHSKYRIVVLANQTVGGSELADEIRAHCEGKDAEVKVVTPALTKSMAQHWASDIDEAVEDARERMQASVTALRSHGLEVSGQIGDSDPNEALNDALREFGADEVIISTHPPERSRWLERGVVERAREELVVPVTHVVVDLEAAQAG